MRYKPGHHMDARAAQLQGIVDRARNAGAELIRAGRVAGDAALARLPVAGRQVVQHQLQAVVIQALADFLRGSITGDLSPLTPAQQYLEAKNQFNAQLGLAQQNNPEAISGISSYFENFIRLSRMVNGSNGNFNVDYFSGYNALAGLTGGQVQPYTNQVAQTLHSQQMAVMVEVKEEIRASKEATIALATFLAEQGITVRSPEIVEAIEANAVTVAGDGFLQSTRTGGLG